MRCVIGKIMDDTKDGVAINASGCGRTASLRTEQP